MYNSLVRFRFWWYERQGRHAEVQALVDSMTRAWALGVLDEVGCRLQVEGREHVPETGALVVVSNHQGAFDIPALAVSLGRIPGFIAKTELFRIPGIAFWMRRLHCIRLDRKDILGGGRMMERESAAIARHGRCLILFPEGTRSRDPEGSIGPFRQGSLRIALAANLPILPVSIDGTRFFARPDAMRRTRRGERLIRVRIAPPCQPNVQSSKDSRALMEELRATIVANREAIRVEWPAAEPEPAGATRQA
ncbi:MAG: 1-acyl-sn-glycerol-3-phosphate acyltransferase [Candidatus Lambdaproteobacteria bacterium]|nr:1-acyl-sn-glycerol-3-phosphate acyltransferase [Candidatus Lambdaproteobacteria bacterium]